MLPAQRVLGTHLAKATAQLPWLTEAVSPWALIGPRAHTWQTAWAESTTPRRGGSWQALAAWMPRWSEAPGTLTRPHRHLALVDRPRRHPPAAQRASACGRTCTQTTSGPREEAGVGLAWAGRREGHH